MEDNDLVDLGLKISAGLHGVLILVALLGGQLFRANDREAELVTTVSLISQGEFAALVDDEAALPETAVEEPEPVETQTDDVVLRQGVTEQGVVADEDTAGELRIDEPDPTVTPEAADIVTDEVNEVPDPVVDEAQTTVEATEEIEGEETPEEAQDATVEEATTTEIVTEADRTERTGAPVRTAIPRARPDSLRPQPQVTETEQTEDPSPEDLIAQEIERVVQEATQAGNSSEGPVSPVPLTAAEANGLIFNIQSCWSLPVGVQNAGALRVVLGIDLTKDGFVDGLPTLVEPAVASTGIQQAFEAARRAVLDCQPYNLPVEKYETWKKLEIEFDPQNMVNR
ncbi:MAG: hypothetical protein AAGJ34_01125 [Pseudomonadota bacterium]